MPDVGGTGNAEGHGYTPIERVKASTADHDDARTDAQIPLGSKPPLLRNTYSNVATISQAELTIRSPDLALHLEGGLSGEVLGLE